MTNQKELVFDKERILRIIRSGYELKKPVKDIAKELTQSGLKPQTVSEFNGANVSNFFRANDPEGFARLRRKKPYTKKKLAFLEKAIQKVNREEVIPGLGRYKAEIKPVAYPNQGRYLSEFNNFEQVSPGWADPLEFTRTIVELSERVRALELENNNLKSRVAGLESKQAQERTFADTPKARIHKRVFEVSEILGSTPADIYKTLYKRFDERIYPFDLKESVEESNLNTLTYIEQEGYIEDLENLVSDIFGGI